MRAGMAIAAGLTALSLCAGAEVPRVMNIVNFMRAVDPRNPPGYDMTKVLAEEVWFNNHYGLKNTILLQYDALLHEGLMNVARQADPDKTEYGFWFEVVKPLCDRLGIAWRGRDGWTWDWHVKPGFLMSYSVADRERLCDEAMRLFREKFGRYPESVGSWLIDAHSMRYMSEKYAIKAFCICREQDNTDAYGLRGGYANGAYYPSRNNMLSAATDMRNAIRTPVFKMLTPCPIYNYGKPNEMYPGYGFHGCPTMEPVWHGGRDRAVIDWFFKTYARPKGALSLSYMQTGQENGFEWERIAQGLPYQMEKIARAQKQDGLIVETLAETGKRFMREHAGNCPQTQVALDDWTGFGRKSVWYNSRFYRGNLFLDGARLSFRDVHVMKDDFREPFFDTVCDGWKADYFTPPFVDTALDRDDSHPGDMVFDGDFESVDVATPDALTLVATARRRDGTAAVVTFRENGMEVRGSGLRWAPKPGRREDVSIHSGRIGLRFQGYVYSVGVTGSVEVVADGYAIRPSGEAIAFSFEVR